MKKPASRKIAKPVALDAVLAERGAEYGSFQSHARITQSIKRDMKATPNWEKLSDSQKESLEMAAHKIGRILNGNQNNQDSWQDLAGYPKLVADELQGIIQ